MQRSIAELGDKQSHKDELRYFITEVDAFYNALLVITQQYADYLESVVALQEECKPAPKERATESLHSWIYEIVEEKCSTLGQFKNDARDFEKKIGELVRKLGEYKLILEKYDMYKLILEKYNIKLREANKTR